MTKSEKRHYDHLVDAKNIILKNKFVARGNIFWKQDQRLLDARSSVQYYSQAATHFHYDVDAALAV